MDRQQILRLYDATYAADYERRFVHSELGRSDAQFEVELLGQLLSDGHRWLDVACGTGYFLAQFPGTLRAGLDLSPAMLERARAANPEIELRQADFRDPQPDWDGCWDLVSCMWYAYGLVESMTDVRTVLANLARWTRPGGTCFLPLADPRLISGCPLPYHDAASPWSGRVYITGITWTYEEDEGRKVHRHMLCPQIEWIEEQFVPWFDELNIVSYPPAMPGWEGVRRALVARGRRLGGLESPS